MKRRKIKQDGKFLAILLTLLFSLSISSGLGYLGYKKIYLSDKTAGIQNMLASVFFVPSITTGQVKAKYNGAYLSNSKVKILIVPGHEPNYGGADWNGRYERDLTVELSEKIAERFKDDPHYTVLMSRNENGWNPSLKYYYDNKWSEITGFMKEKRSEMKRLIKEGEVAKVKGGVPHTRARDDVAIRLFGINKWANDNGVDLIIHVHFNDYPRDREWEQGDYYGFTIYVPDKQYSNAGATAEIAGNVFKRISSDFAVSNYPKEATGVVGDQDLIALGNSNSVNGASMLIEYGYIYENKFSDAKKEATFDKMADDTYHGIKDFFIFPLNAGR